MCDMPTGFGLVQNMRPKSNKICTILGLGGTLATDPKTRKMSSINGLRGSMGIIGVVGIIHALYKGKQQPQTGQWPGRG